MEVVLIICGILIVLFIYSSNKTGKNMYKQDILSLINSLQNDSSIMAFNVFDSLAYITRVQNNIDRDTISGLTVTMYLLNFCYMVKGTRDVKDRDKANIISIILEDTTLCRH